MFIFAIKKSLIYFSFQHDGYSLEKGKKIATTFIA